MGSGITPPTPSERGSPPPQVTVAFFLLMLLTNSMLVAHTITSTSSTLAQAYGTGTYGCGAYQEGCATTSTTPPGVPNTGALLTEPSFVIPGSLLIAVLLAIVTTTIAKLIRRKRRSSSF